MHTQWLLPVSLLLLIWLTASATAEGQLTPQQCARVLVSGVLGAEVNPPDPFPGYGGFNGWQDIVRCKNGDLLVAFCCGYWHVSFPTPFTAPEELKQQYWPDTGGKPPVEAPRGGRIMYIRSTDNGVTWSKPETLIDTQWDDEEPSFTLLADGTLVFNFFVIPGWYGLSEPPPGQIMNSKCGVIRSFDNGHTWEGPDEVHWIGPSFTYYERISTEAIVLQDGGLLLATYGMDTDEQKLHGAIYRSDDKGATWHLIAKITDPPKAIDEPAIAQLPSGRIVLITRSDGSVFFSDDNGYTWSEGHPSGFEMYAPDLVCLPDGTLICIYSQGKVIISTDGGQSWSDAGQLYPVYGYPGAFLMPDETIYTVLYDTVDSTQFHTRVLATAFRVRPDREGIELVPFPGSPEYEAPQAGAGGAPTGDTEQIIYDIDAMGQQDQ